MQIDTVIVAAASDRIDRLHGGRLKPPSAGPSPLPADRLARVTRYINTNRGPDDVAALERAFGTNDLVSLYYFWAGIRAARSVGRIQIPPGPGERGGYATGFMIAPGLLLTNWHVFKTAEAASRARIQFAYETDSAGNDRIPTSYSFVPDRFFVNDKDLDYCVVAVNPVSKQGPEALASFGWLRLNPQLGKTDYGQYLSIIQHPGGQLKQAAIRENRLLPFEDADDFLTYQSDTFRGSSGSPVFNDFWDVVALHHAGKPLKDAQGNYIGHDGQPITDHEPLENEIKWIANEGARTSKVVADLRRRAPQGADRQTIEAAFDGKLKPETPDLEIASKAGSMQENVVIASDIRPVKALDRGFMVMLPLNVSLKVESLIAPPSAAVEAQALPAVTAPAIVRVAEPEEVVFEKLNFDTDYSDRGGYDEGGYWGRPLEYWLTTDYD
jgi:endonuclease G